MSDSGEDSFPNREHYLKASLIGGGAAAVLSLVPVINWLNMFFFTLVIIDGGIDVYWAQKKSGTIKALKDSVIGALSDMVYGAIIFLLGFYLVSGFSLLVLPDMSGRKAREYTMLMTTEISFSCCGTFTIYPMFTGLGGLIATLIWPPSQEGAGGGPKPKPTPEQLTKRKRMFQVVAATLGGCILLCIIFCGISDYLVYLQSRDPEDTAGEEALVQIQVQVSQRQTFDIPAPGTSEWTNYGIWLVSNDSDLPISLYSLDGRIGCRQNYGYKANRKPFMSSMYTYHRRDDGKPAWTLIDTTYSYSNNSISYAFHVEELPARVNSARIMITRVHRPFN